MIKKQAAKIKKKKTIRICTYIAGIIIILMLTLSYKSMEQNRSDFETSVAIEIPQYSGKPYVEVNNNVPFFEAEDYQIKSFEEYSELDMLAAALSSLFAIKFMLFIVKRTDLKWFSLYTAILGVLVCLDQWVLHIFF